MSPQSGSCRRANGAAGSGSSVIVEVVSEPFRGGQGRVGLECSRLFVLVTHRSRIQLDGMSVAGRCVSESYASRTRRRRTRCPLDSTVRISLPRDCATNGCSCDSNHRESD